MHQEHVVEKQGKAGERFVALKTFVPEDALVFLLVRQDLVFTVLADFEEALGFGALVHLGVFFGVWFWLQGVVLGLWGGFGFFVVVH